MPNEYTTSEGYTVSFTAGSTTRASNTENSSPEPVPEAVSPVSRLRRYRPPDSGLENELRSHGMSHQKLSPGTFGIEIEINNIQRLGRNLPPGWEYTNDISVQSKAKMFRGKPVQYLTKKFEYNIKTERVGVEIVSPVLSNFEDMLDVLDNIKETGIKTKSMDCGVHVHVSYPRGDAIVSLFKLALKYEPLFYAVGTFGGFSRGVRKGYIYQRPLIHPPIVKIAASKNHLESGKVYHGYAFDVNKFHLVTNEAEFKDFIAEQIGGKYHAAKYCGINFYSHFYRSTVELRTFNLTTNYSYLKAAVNLSRDFVFAGIRDFYAGSEGADIQINNINNLSTEDLLILFDEFQSKYTNFMDSEDTFTIKELISRAPAITIPEKTFFHLMFHRNGDNSRIHIYRDDRFLPEKLDTTDAIKPTAEDLVDYEF